MRVADAAGHHQGDRKGLGPQPGQVSTELSIEHPHDYHDHFRRPDAVCSLIRIRDTVPSMKWMTRWAILRMAALCVMMTTVVESSSLTFASASRTRMPVFESSAARVGSSHSSTVRALGDGARGRHPLLLPADDNCAGEMVLALLKADESQRLVRRHGIARDFRRQRDVLPGGEARDEVVELEHEADVVAPVTA